MAQQMVMWTHLKALSLQALPPTAVMKPLTSLDVTVLSVCPVAAGPVTLLSVLVSQNQ